ncbi:helix-turn-helix transcriptional regulator [Bradyrhizobium sp. USDA 4473]
MAATGPALSPRDVSIPRFALRREEAAASVGVSPTKFDEWVRDRRMPKGRKIDGVVLWDVGEVREAWERLRDGELPAKNPFDGVTA